VAPEEAGHSGHDGPVERQRGTQEEARESWRKASPAIPRGSRSYCLVHPEYKQSGQDCFHDARDEEEKEGHNMENKRRRLSLPDFVE